MDNLKKFLGSGIIFPIELNQLGRVNVYTDIPLIRASILHIVNWPMAHRYFNERFGCRIEECLEEPSDGVTLSMMRYFIIDALEKWEKRIIPINISILPSDDNTIINVKLIYQVSGTKNTDTFIFPFYKNIIY